MFQSLNDLNLSFLAHTRAIQQRRQRRHVVGAKDGIHPRRLLHHHIAILLREAATNGDLHAGVMTLDFAQLTKRAV